MRTVLAMLLGIALVSTSAFAAWDDCSCSCPSYSPVMQPGMPSQPMMKKTSDAGSSDGYFLKNGKVMVFRNGNISEVNQEVTLSNGGRLMADGSIVFTDGRREMLRDNQWLTLDGQISDSAQAINRSDSFQSGQMNQDGYFLQNGRVMMFRNGQSSQLTNEMTLSDGSRIMSDGTIITRDGTRSTLREGQRLDFQGRTSVNASHQQVQPSNMSHDRVNDANRNQNNSGQFNNQNRDNSQFNNQNRDSNSTNQSGTQFNSTNRSSTSGQVNDNHAKTETHVDSRTTDSIKHDATNRSNTQLNSSTTVPNQGNQVPTNSARPNDRSTSTPSDTKHADTSAKPNDRSTTAPANSAKPADSSRPNDRSPSETDSTK